MAEKQLTLPQQCAIAALKIISGASGGFDDATMQTVANVKGFLRGIASGELVVGKAIAEDADGPVDGKINPDGSLSAQTPGAGKDTAAAPSNVSPISKSKAKRQTAQKASEGLL